MSEEDGDVGDVLSFEEGRIFGWSISSKTKIVLLFELTCLSNLGLTDLKNFIYFF